jgi:hypothetical protein
MSRDGHLPPGVEYDDIPGNRTEDQEWEDLFDWLAGTGLETDEIRRRVDRGETDPESLVCRCGHSWDRHGWARRSEATPCEECTNCGSFRPLAPPIPTVV